MLNAIINLLVCLALYILEGVLICGFAMNEMWIAMTVSILFVPLNASELKYAYTMFLYELLRHLKGEDEFQNFINDMQNNDDNKNN